MALWIAFLVGHKQKYGFVSRIIDRCHHEWCYTNQQMRVQWIDAECHFLLVAVAVWVRNKRLFLHTSHDIPDKHTLASSLIQLTSLCCQAMISRASSLCAAVGSVWICYDLDVAGSKKWNQRAEERGQRSQTVSSLSPIFWLLYANVCVAFKLVSVGRISSHNMCGRPNGHRTT